VKNRFIEGFSERWWHDTRDECVWLKVYIFGSIVWYMKRNRYLWMLCCGHRSVLWWMISLRLMTHEFKINK